MKKENEEGKGPVGRGEGRGKETLTSLLPVWVLFIAVLISVGRGGGWGFRRGRGDMRG